MLSICCRLIILSIYVRLTLTLAKVYPLSHLITCWLRSLHKVVIEGPEVDILEKIKKARDKDEEIVRVVEEMKKAGVKVVREEEWQLEGDLVLKKRKVYVPKNEELRVEIIWLHYDMPVVGHEGK